MSTILSLLSFFVCFRSSTNWSLIWTFDMIKRFSHQTYFLTFHFRGKSPTLIIFTMTIDSNLSPSNEFLKWSLSKVETSNYYIPTPHPLVHGSNLLVLSIISLEKKKYKPPLSYELSIRLEEVERLGFVNLRCWFWV